MVLVLLDLLRRRASALRGARAAALRRLLLAPRRRRRRGPRGLRGPRPRHAERTALHLRLLLLLELLQRDHVVAHERELRLLTHDEVERPHLHDVRDRTWNFWMNLLQSAVTSIVGPFSRRICSSWSATENGFKLVSSRTIE